MTIPFQLNNPNRSNPPTLDQPNMTQNNNSIVTWTGIDHVGFNTPGGGYHTTIHAVTQTNVTQISNLLQLVAGIPNQLTYTTNAMVPVTKTAPNIPSNSDTQLYVYTGQGGFQQLTGNVAATEGLVWCSGILFQWGTATVTSGTHTIPFSPNFPTACYNVQATIQNVSAGPGSVYFQVNSFTASAFTYTATGVTSIYWFAIGN